MAKISELPKNKFETDLIDNCFCIEKQNNLIPMRSIFDWIIEQAKEGDFKITLNEEKNQITFSKIEKPSN
jgi:hypothetical protein